MLFMHSILVFNQISKFDFDTSPCPRQATSKMFIQYHGHILQHIPFATCTFFILVCQFFCPTCLAYYLSKIPQTQLYFSHLKTIENFHNDENHQCSPLTKFALSRCGAKQNPIQYQSFCFSQCELFVLKIEKKNQICSFETSGIHLDLGPNITNRPMNQKPDLEVMFGSLIWVPPNFIQCNPNHLNRSCNLLGRLSSCNHLTSKIHVIETCLNFLEKSGGGVEMSQGWQETNAANSFVLNSQAYLVL